MDKRKSTTGKPAALTPYQLSKARKAQSRYKSPTRFSGNFCAVYAVVNRKTGFAYIGGANQVRRRCNEHYTALNRNMHWNKALQKSWDEHKKYFEFKILEKCNPENLRSREQYWLDKTRNIFNMCPLATSSLGVKQSDETRANIRAGLLRAGLVGKPLSLETREKIGRAQRGRIKGPLSLETRIKISKALQGRKFSPETLAKRRATILNRPPFHLSEETKAKLRKARLGTHASMATRKKMSATRLLLPFGKGRGRPIR